MAILWLLAAWVHVQNSATTVATYHKALTLSANVEWRFRPLVVDLNLDKHPDLVATARIVDPSLRIWFGDGKGNLEAVKSTWTSIGYAALATGDVNRDRFPDIVAASHFGSVQTLLSDGKGGFTETILRLKDGYVAVQLGDLNRDGSLDLVLIGYRRVGIQIYLGDGTGNWTLNKTLLEPKTEQSMPGRDVLVSDLNHDGHLDVVAAFQRWGIHIYLGDARGDLKGGLAAFRPPEHIPEALVIEDVNRDGHPDIAVIGDLPGKEQANGPDVYLGDGHGGWKASSAGLKVLKATSDAIALGDLDQDGNLDVVAGGNVTAKLDDGYGLFWFKGDGKGGWSLVKDCGLPTQGLSRPSGIGLADFDRDGLVEIVLLAGGRRGSLTIWKRQVAPSTVPS